MSNNLWSSRWTYIIAWIGSAAWLWNLWRFAFQVFDNWWWAFIIAYLVIMILVWFALVVWEAYLWQSSWKTSAWAMRSQSKYLSFIWYSSLIALSIVWAYYLPVIWWWVDYFYYALESLFTWVFAWWADPSSFFYWNVLWLTSSPWEVWEISMPVVYGSFVAIVLTYLAIFKSTQSVWKVVWFTVTAPFITLAILAIKWLTLPWWMDGIMFLLQTDLSKLLEISTWAAAVWQIFFSLSIWYALVITYAAFKPEKEEFVSSTMIIAVWNAFISFLSAIAVFSSLGYMAHSSWKTISEISNWWPGLVFEAFPAIFNSFSPLAWSIFAILFFWTILLLAIDTFMALWESLAKWINDSLKKEIDSKILSAIVLLVVFTFSMLIFSKWNWLYLLDIIDNYLNKGVSIIVWLLTLIILLSRRKKVVPYLLERSSAPKWFVNKYTIIWAWIVSFFLVWYIMISNFLWDFMNYGGYDREYIMIWIYTVIAVWGLWMVFNTLEIIFKKETK